MARCEQCGHHELPGGLTTLWDGSEVCIDCRRGEEQGMEEQRDSVYVLEGVTSEGESFDFPGVRFNSMVEAMRYAITYARGVSSTDNWVADHSAGWVRAVGDEYSETIRVREIVR